MSAGKPTALGGSRPTLAAGALSIPYSGLQGYTYQFPPGSYTFTAPAAGYWKFVLWGAGGGAAASAATGAGSGAYVEITRVMGVGEAASITVATMIADSDGGDTTISFADGRSATAGGGKSGDNGGAGGAPSGLYDFALNGSAGGSGMGAAGQGTGGGAGGTGTGGGGGAPARLPFRGGAGGPGANNSSRGQTPGAGGGIHSNNFNVVSYGGEGMLIALFVRN